MEASEWVWVHNFQVLLTPGHVPPRSSLYGIFSGVCNLLLCHSWSSLGGAEDFSRFVCSVSDDQFYPEALLGLCPQSLQ